MRRYSFWEDEDYIRYQIQREHMRGRTFRDRKVNYILTFSMEDAVHWFDLKVGPVLAQDSNTMEMLVQDPSGKVHTFEVVRQNRNLRGRRDINILLMTDRVAFDRTQLVLEYRQAWMRDPIDQGVLNFGWFVKAYMHVLADTTNTRDVSYYGIKPLRGDLYEL